MAVIPKRAADRIRSGLKKFQPILDAARSRDVNESDTVVIVTDLLQEIFGYDKYSEITSEHMIRGTFCDLAVKLDSELTLLIEVKAIGIDLKDQHVKQAIDYAVNQGVDWVTLTNGKEWRVYKVIFAKPIEHELVMNVDFLSLSHRNAADVEMLGLLAKEGWRKAALRDYHTQQEALNKYTLGALILSKPVLELVRRELRRASPGVKISIEDIESALTADVIKREVAEGERAELAKKQLAKAAGKALRKRQASTGEPKEPPTNTEQ